MSIRRGPIARVDHFTIIPNDWVRDHNLSRRAKGLLCELMSHREGWEITIDSLMASGPEGRDAIRGAILELEAAGYLRQERERDAGGRLKGSDYTVTDPCRSEPKSDFPTLAQPTLADPPTKKTIPTEDQKDSSAAIAAGAFEEFWTHYPRKIGKLAAEKAWRKATKSTDPYTIIAAVKGYAFPADRQFIPHPASWLNAGRWMDEQAKVDTRQPWERFG